LWWPYIWWGSARWWRRAERQVEVSIHVVLLGVPLHFLPWLVVLLLAIGYIIFGSRVCFLRRSRCILLGEILVA
jgi:hypothetical protein